jgi:hypothetical protein
MHSLTIRTKFTFGDRVRFDSPTQRCAGQGAIWAITIDAEGFVDYMIRLDDDEFQPGILENELSLLANAGI